MNDETVVRRFLHDGWSIMTIASYYAMEFSTVEDAIRRWMISHDRDED